MKDLMQVAKEATSSIINKYPVMDETPYTEEGLKDILDIVLSTYKKQSFWCRITNSFNSYKLMVLLDLRYNFIGGGVLMSEGYTIISIQEQKK